VFYHPKVFLTLTGFYQVLLACLSWFFPTLIGVCPNQGDKKSEEPISLPTSASQTLVKFAVRLSQTAPTVNKCFFTFFWPVLREATGKTLANRKRGSTGF
jgi:hypothetical protein